MLHQPKGFAMLIHTDFMVTTVTTINSPTTMGIQCGYNGDIASQTIEGKRPYFPYRNCHHWGHEFGPIPLMLV
jgi:hypothetical protein